MTKVDVVVSAATAAFVISPLVRAATNNASYTLSILPGATITATPVGTKTW